MLMPNHAGVSPSVRELTSSFRSPSRRFYLEICIYNQICANGAELFHLARGQAWECQLSAAGLVRLKEMLLAEPDWGPPHGGSE